MSPLWTAVCGLETGDFLSAAAWERWRLAGVFPPNFELWNLELLSRRSLGEGGWNMELLSRRSLGEGGWNLAPPYRAISSATGRTTAEVLAKADG